MISKKTLQREKHYYIVTLLLMIFIGFLSYFLAPLMLIGGSVSSLLITFILGICLGWFISVFIRELDHLTHHHHSALIIVVLVGAFVSFTTVYSSLTFGLNAISTGIWHALLFSVAFIIPYFSSLREW